MPNTVVKMLEERYRCPVWTDADGNHTPLVIMSERYLMNVWNLLKRQHEGAIAYINKVPEHNLYIPQTSILALPVPNGEMAEMDYWAAAEQEAENYMLVHLIREQYEHAWTVADICEEWMPKIVAEIQRRGIELPNPVEEKRRNLLQRLRDQIANTVRRA